MIPGAGFGYDKDAYDAALAKGNNCAPRSSRSGFRYRHHQEAAYLLQLSPALGVIWAEAGVPAPALSFYGASQVGLPARRPAWGHFARPPIGA